MSDDQAKAFMEGIVGPIGDAVLYSHTFKPDLPEPVAKATSFTYNIGPQGEQTVKGNFNVTPLGATVLADIFDVPPWLVHPDQPVHRWTWRLRRRWRMWRS